MEGEREREREREREGGRERETKFLHRFNLPRLAAIKFYFVDTKTKEFCTVTVQSDVLRCFISISICYKLPVIKSYKMEIIDLQIIYCIITMLRRESVYWTLKYSELL